MGASAPFWRYSAASYPDLEGTKPIDALVGVKNRNLIGENELTVGVRFLFLTLHFTFFMAIILFTLFLL